MGIYETEVIMDLCLKDCLDTRHRGQENYNQRQDNIKECQCMAFFKKHSKTKALEYSK